MGKKLGTQRGKDYYNKAIARDCMPLEESPWLKLYNLAADALPKPWREPKIMDLGCGTGRFARLLYNRGYEHYLGIDFSDVRISIAQFYVPQYEFRVQGVLAPETQRLYNDFNTFVILEVLEHINFDVPLLKALPSGANVILSVPNYGADSHVRKFKNLGAVNRRYGKILRVIDERTVWLSSDNKIFMWKAVRRIRK
jgi:2-polyprenyl-3-methyl-5-hydroxy-6-metoxy-1,4-benzoquinol methylase